MACNLKVTGAYLGGKSRHVFPFEDVHVKSIQASSHGHAFDLWKKNSLKRHQQETTEEGRYERWLH